MVYLNYKKACYTAVNTDIALLLFTVGVSRLWKPQASSRTVQTVT